MKAVTTDRLAEQLLVGKRIKRVTINRFETGRPGHPVSTRPVIELEDGSYLDFTVAETDIGDYGIELTYTPKG